MVEANSRPIDAPRADDAFGEMVWDYYTDDLTERPHYRRDDGDVTEAHLEGYFSDPDDWPAIVRETLDALDGPVLDAGCGVGRHARYLQERSVDVFAIDRSPGAVALARELGVDHAAVMDMRDVSILEDTFETVAVIGKQLAVGDSLADLRVTLESLASATRPGGRLIADFDAPERRADDYLADHWIDDDAAYRRFRIEYDGLVGPWVDVLLLEPTVLERVVAETSWTITDMVGRNEEGSGYLVTFQRV